MIRSNSTIQMIALYKDPKGKNVFTKSKNEIINNAQKHSSDTSGGSSSGISGNVVENRAQVEAQTE